MSVAPSRLFSGDRPDVNAPPVDRSAPTPTPTAPRVSLVIPAKDEAGNVPWVLSRIPNRVDEVVLVDGLSSDDTVAIAKMVRADLVVVTQTRPGKGAAVREGFSAATGDYIVMMDADCSMDPAEIERFVGLLDAGSDFVKGSRFMDGGGTADMTYLRRVGNRGLLQLTNILYGASFSDLCYGFVAFRRSILGELKLTADGFDIEMQLIARALRTGQRITETPSFEAPRRYGTSNLRAVPDGIRVLRSLLRERFSRDGSRSRNAARTSRGAT